MPRGNNLGRVATNVDQNQFDMAIEIFTRGDPWDSLADPVDQAAHALLMADVQLNALASDIRRISEVFESQEADRTAGVLTVHYRVTFLTAAGDIGKPG